MAHKNFYLSVKERNLLIDLIYQLYFTDSIDLSLDDFNDLRDLRFKLLNSLDK